MGLLEVLLSILDRLTTIPDSKKYEKIKVNLVITILGCFVKMDNIKNPKYPITKSIARWGGYKDGLFKDAIVLIPNNRLNEMEDVLLTQLIDRIQLEHDQLLKEEAEGNNEEAEDKICTICYAMPMDRQVKNIIYTFYFFFLHIYSFFLF